MKCCAVKHKGARFISRCTKSRQKYLNAPFAHEAHAQIDLLFNGDSDYIPDNNKNKGNALGS
jgi:hypothetical protein